MNNDYLSVWDKNSDAVGFSALQGDKRTDVLIIGGGIAGILTAYFLQQRGIDYILVERYRICKGITHCTTAKITAQHGFVYQKLLKSFGTEQAKMYLKANLNAIERYAELCRNIDCDFEYRDNYVYCREDRKKLERELSALQSIHFNAGLCENIDIPVANVGAIRFEKQAQFNPLKFLYAISSNLNIYENTFVTDIDGNTAYYDRGRITAKSIIVASHFPFINTHGSYPLKLYQHRSYVIALENAKSIDAMYVDEGEGGMSFRNYKNYMLLGGAGHRTGKSSGSWQELRDFAKKHYPDAKEKCCWATQDCMSLDGVAYIGNYSKTTPNLYVATGFNKWGMTTAMVSAELLCDLVCDKSNEYAGLFSPSRSIIKPQLFVNGFEAVFNLLTPTTKRCPHLGCALKWNSAEHTWDCPCHGSRFEKDGRLIDNPSLKDL